MKIPLLSFATNLEQMYPVARSKTENFSSFPYFIFDMWTVVWFSIRPFLIGFYVRSC
jgi:hypothetical protein